MPFSFWQKPPDLDDSAYTYGARVFEDDSKIAEISATHCWSPIVFKGGHRLKDNFLYADWLGVDFDDGDLTLQQAIDTFRDCECAIGTTRNHQKWKGNKPPCDRFRLVIRLESRCTRIEEYEETARFYVRKYASDKSAADGARYFRTSSLVFSTVGQEDMLTQEIFAPKPKPKPAVIRGRGGQYFPSALYLRTKRNTSSVEKRNNTLFLIGADMKRQGMSEDFIRQELTTIIPTSPTFTMHEIEGIIKSVLKNVD